MQKSRRESLQLGRTVSELKEQYIQDNKEQAEKTEEHQSLLNDFQL